MINHRSRRTHGITADAMRDACSCGCPMLAGRATARRGWFGTGVRGDTASAILPELERAARVAVALNRGLRVTETGGKCEDQKD
jgi:hypothetical protein